jgi:hypothetical protein
MAITSLEERLTAVEKDLAQLKQKLENDKPLTAVPWWQQISGTFRDDPMFDEAMRLGREWRNSQHEEHDNNDPGNAEDARVSS